MKTSNNCLTCDNENKGLYLLKDKNNCEYSNFSGYYLNIESKTLKKCYISCKTCNGPYEIDNNINIENHNCIECAENYYKLSNGSLQNNCYDNDTINSWKNIQETTNIINTSSMILFGITSNIIETTSKEKETNSSIVETSIYEEESSYKELEDTKYNSNQVKTSYNEKGTSYNEIETSFQEIFTTYNSSETIYCILSFVPLIDCITQIKIFLKINN